MKPEAAGILMMDPDGRVLFVRRSDTGMWATPAGHIEYGETPWEAAAREIYEETGYQGPYTDVEKISVVEGPNVDFHLFSADVPQSFIPHLDEEHTNYRWRPLRQAPEPLHWGLRWLKS